MIQSRSIGSSLVGGAADPSWDELIHAKAVGISNVLPFDLSKMSIANPSAKMADLTREEIQAKLETLDARTDTKIVRMEGKLDLVLQTLQSTRDEARDNRRAIIANAWVIFAALVAIVGILAAVTPIVFDMGSRWRETITKEVQDRVQDLNGPKSSK
jgi:hypothetical protein